MQSIKMTPAEKTDVLQRALSAIDVIEAAHAASLEAHIHRGVKSVFAHTWNIYIAEKKFVPTLAIAAVLLVFGAFSVEAENALPGDSLYSLKVNVNEPVRGLAALTPEAKAKFALEVTDQRLKEVALLSSQGKLDDATRQIVEKQLLHQSGEVTNQVASLVAVNNVKAAQEIVVSLESSLKAHELILQKISSDQASTSTSTSTSHLDSILNTVKTELATSTESRVSFQTQELNLDAYNREKVTKKLGDVRGKFEEFKKTLNDAHLSSSTLSVVSAYLGEINQFVIDSGYFVSKENYPQALVKLQQAEQLISDGDAIMSADTTTAVSLRAIVSAALSTATTTFSPVTIPADTTHTASTASSTNITTTTSTTTTVTSTISTDGGLTASSTLATSTATSTI